ncbi:AraC family transcriptional regulator [Vreelandella zhanjiangensis]|uniref:AraC family transcriptional regulator n=2 Tax=Halomonadaceae TaxID=28256 RepID=UPI000369AADA|nr:AraC family transcriptional regulator [Halomonas zhanjiangensis]
MSIQHQNRINEVLFHIHRDISRPLSAKALADVAAYSEQHFHRLFKRVVGESIHQYIRRVRMEYAANQLMFDSHSSVLDIANRCGFSSASSFNKAFNSIFHCSPTTWRQQEQPSLEKNYLKDPDVALGFQSIAGQALPSPRIIETPTRFVAYKRHHGYNRSIQEAWMTLIAWAKAEQRDTNRQYGLHHSNPAWVELEQCHYVACLEIDTPVSRHSIISQLVIPEGLHAVFHLTGKYGELLPQISQVFKTWLPTSKFKLRSTPGYVRYHKNQFLSEDETFDLEFYLPISFF